VAAAIERLGGLDVLVNNAGVALEQPVLETTEEAWRSTLAVNLDAAVFASIAAARAMLDRGGGAIVNVASTDGLVPEAPMVAYNASKAALLSVTRSMAVELGPYGIRVNAVAPGETATPMTDDELADPRFVGAYLPQIPLRRFSTAEEQAAVILFLASDEASYVNGATLVVDGGQLAGTWYYPWMAPGQQGDV
jgi:3-oxoacyl-[acyl-carrier protein] reductase